MSKLKDKESKKVRKHKKTKKVEPIQQRMIETGTVELQPLPTPMKEGKSITGTIMAHARATNLPLLGVERNLPNIKIPTPIESISNCGRSWTTLSNSVVNVGQVYLHNKTGRYYVVVGFSRHHEDLAVWVHYLPFDEIFSDSIPYNRPLTNFLELVPMPRDENDIEQEDFIKPRFELYAETLYDYMLKIKTS